MFAELKSMAQPIAWSRSLAELDTSNENNNGLQNEDLIVWMRTAALPSFRKLYRRVSHEGAAFEHGLKRGNYILRVKYSKRTSYVLLMKF
jgi:hypothetical protein